MDRIPKFRRKPKNPTIETAIERSSSDTIDSFASAELQAANFQQQQEQPQQPPPQKPPKFSKKNAFRNFRLRASAKRARESPTAELPSNSPPAAIVSQDGIKSRPATADGYALRNGRATMPKLPTFLDLTQNNNLKFRDLAWTESNRVFESNQNEADQDFKWSMFKQSDMEEKGVMDRYTNIKPWNHNRIRLQVPPNELDYVNASEIALESNSDPDLPPLRYIAMQGPTEPSIPYVWRMIAEQLSSPTVIVQLTTMVENGLVKCNQYFPDSEEHTTWPLNEENAWGDDWKASLTFDSYEELSDGAIEKRKLLLHVEGEEEPRVIWHLLYCRWPDFGVPELEDVDSFFEIMRLSREYSARSNPRIIHCSAGIGRTGTFIALEHLRRELDVGYLENYDYPTEGPDLIYDTVDVLREQRIGMVQSMPQYLFIYQVLRKLWQDKYGIEDDGAEPPAAKRLEVVGEPSLDAGPGPDVGEVGIAK